MIPCRVSCPHFCEGCHKTLRHMETLSGAAGPCAPPEKGVSGLSQRGLQHDHPAVLPSPALSDLPLTRPCARIAGPAARGGFLAVPDFRRQHEGPCSHRNRGLFPAARAGITERGASQSGTALNFPQARSAATARAYFRDNAHPSFAGSASRPAPDFAASSAARPRKS